MAKEIERKFLVDLEKWDKKGRSIAMEQAYLSVENNKVVRVRIAGDCAYLTIKGNLQGITRDEFEYEIPVNDARQLIKMGIGYCVRKTRYVEQIGGKTWEVDEFEDENKGLVVAEIELKSEGELFEKPVWILDEVSTDERYYNFNLAMTPYLHWQ